MYTRRYTGQNTVVSPLFGQHESYALSASLLQNETVLPYADANAMQTIFVVSNAIIPELSHVPNRGQKHFEA
jgi:hypothetical protein